MDEILLSLAIYIIWSTSESSSLYYLGLDGENKVGNRWVGQKCPGVWCCTRTSTHPFKLKPIVWTSSWYVSLTFSVTNYNLWLSLYIMEANRVNKFNESNDMYHKHLVSPIIIFGYLYNGSQLCEQVHWIQWYVS